MAPKVLVITCGALARELVLLVEQNGRAALANASRIYVRKLGRIGYDGAPEPLHDKSRLMELF